MYAITQFATMVLNALGTVECCDAATDRLFGVGSGELVGCDLAALLHGLPLRRDTPGYNLAYATYWAGGDNSCTAFVRRSDGSSLPVRIRFERPPRLEGGSILLVLDVLDAMHAAPADRAPRHETLPCN